MVNSGLAKDVILLSDKDITSIFEILNGEKISRADSEVYGFVSSDGTIYLNSERLSANTPIHEFGHLFWSIMPQETKSKLTTLLKQTAEWKRIKNLPAYANLKNDDAIADEVFNTILGDYGENSQRVQKIIGKDITLVARIKNAINEFWEWLKSLFGTEAKINHFAKQTLGELLSGKNLSADTSNANNSRLNANLEFAKQSDYDFDVTGITEANAQEMKSIKETAISNGTFLKAPNGKDTNLNERQWLQVRTKSFKQWFGDWEKNPSKASKVIDENDEPQVVYYGDKFMSHFDDTRVDRRFWDSKTMMFFVKKYSDLEETEAQINELHKNNKDWADTSKKIEEYRSKGICNLSPDEHVAYDTLLKRRNSYTDVSKQHAELLAKRKEADNKDVELYEKAIKQGDLQPFFVDIKKPASNRGYIYGYDDIKQYDGAIESYPNGKLVVIDAYNNTNQVKSATGNNAISTARAVTSASNSSAKKAPQH